jgi:hypothetical protein
MSNFRQRCLGLSIVALLVTSIAIEADDDFVDPLTARQAANLIENQRVEVSKDGDTLLVPQISQADLGSKQQSYIRLIDGSFVRSQSLACPAYVYPASIIYRTYRKGLAFPPGWRIIAQSNGQLLVFTGPFTLAPIRFTYQGGNQIIGFLTNREVGGEIEMRLQYLGAFRIGSIWDKMLDSLVNCKLISHYTPPNTGVTCYQIQLGQNTQLMDLFIGALTTNSDYQMLAKTEGACFKELNFGDSPSDVQAKMQRVTDMPPMMPEVLTRYGIQPNKTDLIYAGYFSGLPVIIRCIFTQEDGERSLLTELSFNYVMKGYNANTDALTDLCITD